ncbi:MAG: PAAR domain-containing protein [Myxococcota bacterium]
MTKPVAKANDLVVALDTHVVMVPSPAGPVPTPTPMPFKGTLGDALATSVQVEDEAAAVVGSKAKNDPPHLPIGGTSFQTPPSDEGTVQLGSSTVLFEDQGAARMGDTAITCNDPVDKPGGKVITTGATVLAGD